MSTTKRMMKWQYHIHARNKKIKKNIAKHLKKKTGATGKEQQVVP